MKIYIINQVLNPLRNNIPIYATDIKGAKGSCFERVIIAIIKNNTPEKKKKNGQNDKGIKNNKIIINFISPHPITDLRLYASADNFSINKLTLPRMDIIKLGRENKHAKIAAMTINKASGITHSIMSTKLTHTKNKDTTATNRDVLKLITRHIPRTLRAINHFETKDFWL